MVGKEVAEDLVPIMRMQKLLFFQAIVAAEEVKLHSNNLQSLKW
jgi:hypothetical protein